MKYFNYLLLLLLLVVGLIFKEHIHISTNLLSLFATKETLQKFNIADKLGYSKEMIVLVKGFSSESKTKVETLATELKKLKYINSVDYKISPSVEIKNYYKDYYPILSDFNSTSYTKEKIFIKLDNIYKDISTSLFYTNVNKFNPLELFVMKQVKKNISHKGNYITLGDYGYILHISTDVSPSNLTKAEHLYKDVHSLLDRYNDVISFAPFYYSVENSKKIKDDVNKIIILSTLVLLMIYYLLLKNLQLLIHTIIALVSSMLVATYISLLFFENFSALSLAFGMSVTAVSIDYLLHYYFHDFYNSSQKVDKSVLYGYLTTVVAFGVFSFIPIPIISQISFFTVISLSFAYLLFTFIFPYLEIKRYITDRPLYVSEKKISSKSIAFLSLLLLCYSFINIKLDTNIRNIDYQNIKLLEIQSLLTKLNNSKLKPIIVEADNQVELIKRLHMVKNLTMNSFSLANFVVTKKACEIRKREIESYDFKKLNKNINLISSEIGFKDGYFRDSYKFIETLPPCELENFDFLQPLNLGVYQENKKFYSIALVDDITKIKNNFKFVSSLSAKDIFSKSSFQMYEDLLLYSLIVLVVILILLFLSVKVNFLYALNYIIFPVSITLAILTSYTAINIMHIFSFIILIAIGIDYGIYMSNSSQPSNTILAIKYSILSTFAAFGVLIFSTIVALNSIGMVITIGVGAIFILIKVMK